MPAKIQIPDPCHVPWSEMSAVEAGRYCDSCKKTVTDFTGMSDKEIKSAFAKANTQNKNLCGRFRADQLDRPLENPKSAYRRVARTMAMAAGLTMTVPAMAQEKPVKIEKHDNAGHELPSRSKEIKPSDTILRGVVVDSTHAPIPSATIILKGTGLRTITDFDGQFIINTSFEGQKMDTIIVTGLGLKKRELHVDSVSMDKPIILNRDTLESVITTTGGICYRPSLWQRFLNLFRSEENKRYH